jgi:hypothetical protein
MRQAKHMIAVSLMAAALCADRAVMAAPKIEPEAVRVTTRWIDRLSDGLRQNVPAVRLFPVQRSFASVVVRENFKPVRSIEPVAFAFTPFQFRLPPPVI